MEKVIIKGIAKKTIFSADSGYTIALFRVKNTDDEESKPYIDSTISIVGYFPPLDNGEEYDLEGSFVVHQKYGHQFKVDKYQRKELETTDEIVSFLSSGLFPGIGEKTASAIVDILGEDALTKIVEEPSCLNLIPKLTQKKATRLYHTLLNHQNSQDTMSFLYTLNLNPRLAMKIYKTFGEDAQKLINENPYQIISVIDGLSFKHADFIASKIGISFNDERRIIQAFISSCINECYKEGHSYLTKDQLFNATNNLLDSQIDMNHLDYVYDEVISSGELVLDNEMIYHPTFLEAENSIVNKMKIFLKNDNFKKSVKNEELKNFIKVFEQNKAIKYSQNQINAIKNTLTSSVSIITGGPGTGKTTVIKGIVELYTSLFNRTATRPLAESDIALIAPTGRAAKRMSEQTYLPASTIHRFLKWDQSSDTFQYNEFNQVRCKLVIVDEVSMLDMFLMDNLLKALPDSVQIIFVGDDKQLPSVAPGNVLCNLIESSVINVTNLDVIYRQDNESSLIEFAHNIRNGVVPSDLLNKFSDRNFLECNKFQVPDLVEKVATSAKNKGYGYEDMQVLIPMYKGVAGIDVINKRLQQVFNPPSEDKNEIKYGHIIFRVQDKVLLLKNRPNDNVFNGDMGIIRVIKYSKNSDSKKNEILVDFDGNLVTFYPQDFIELTHGYSISIHKSQGGEFRLVIMPVISSYSRMLQRKLIYTGVTRAKESLVLIGESDAFEYGISHQEITIRQTRLLEKLKNFN